MKIYQPLGYQVQSKVHRSQCFLQPTIDYNLTLWEFLLDVITNFLCLPDHTKIKELNLSVFSKFL